MTIIPNTQQDNDETLKYSWVFTLKPIRTGLSNIHGLGPYNMIVTNYQTFMGFFDPKNKMIIRTHKN